MLVVKNRIASVTITFCILTDIDKGMTVVPVLSDILCKACKLEGDLECIKRHCLTSASGPKGNF